MVVVTGRVRLGCSRFATALAPVHQQYLLQARQMQALSFTVHIPLVCFGIAFPAMVLFVEWLYLRTGDPLYRTLARRWTRVMVALFAVGVITGTILSFEMGLLWPNFTATFGCVFGLGFAIEGFSFFTEAIFIGIYVYGWDRLSPRLHLLSGIPIVIAGFTGSLMVISVNAWMNHPAGFRLAGGKVVDVHPLQALFGNRYLWHELIHMYIAGYIVTGFVVAAAYASDGCAAGGVAIERTAFAIPLTIAALASPVQVLVGDWVGRDVADDAADQAGGDRGPLQDHPGRPRAHPRLVHRRPGQVRDRDPAPALAAGLPQLERDGQGARHGARPTSAAGQRRARRRSRRWWGSARCWRCSASSTWSCGWRRRRLPESRWFYRAVVAPGPLSVVALIAGWVTTEVGRQPWVVYGVMRDLAGGHRRQRHPGRLRDAAPPSTWASSCAVAWVLRRLARAPLDTPGRPSASPAPGAGRSR